MIFTTTLEQEKKIDANYLLKVQKKQKEIDDRIKKTGKIEKYTGYAYVTKPSRTFYYENSQIYLEINGIKELCSNNINNLDNLNNSNDLDLDEISKKVGRIYKTDSDFDIKIKDFITRNDSWKIIFYPSKTDGGVYYCTDNKFDVPAELKSLGNSDVLLLEDDDKYEICCG